MLRIGAASRGSAPAESAAALAHRFEDEVFHRLRGQRTFGLVFGLVCLVIALLSMVAVSVTFPLKEIRPYVLMVDRTTGEAEKVVQVRPMLLSEEEVVRQAELVRYVTDRETYDYADNRERIPLVLERSREQAAATLQTLWNSSNQEYPPDFYGLDVVVTVIVKSVSLLTPTSAQVRFAKRREAPGDRPIERDFVATVGFAFEPRTEARLEDVWTNPLGFIVTNYRIDAETLQPRSE